MGSGYADYSEVIGKYVDVPVIMADAVSLVGYAEIVTNFEEAEVMQVQWPQRGKRPLDEGTGYGGVVSGNFSFRWITDENGDQLLMAQNEAVGGNYTVSRKTKDGWYTREANYHPDSGQIVYGKDPFIILMALPGDDVTAADFRAFYCDGTFGIQILPGVWHQPVLPLVQSTSYKNKQGSIHGCVVYDSVKEEGVWLRIVP